MRFIRRLQEIDFQIFLKEFYAHYKISNNVVLKNINHLKNDVFMLSCQIDGKEVSLLVSDQSFKISNSNQIAQHAKISEEEFKQVAKLEWQGFMVAKYGVEYISDKMLFKPWQTKIFKLSDKYSKGLSSLKTSAETLKQV